MTAVELLCDAGRRQTHHEGRQGAIPPSSIVIRPGAARSWPRRRDADIFKCAFHNPFNLLGRSSPPAQIFYFRFSETCDLLRPSRLHKRGVSRSSRTWEVGCGGRDGGVRRALPGRTVKSRGSGAVCRGKARFLRGCKSLPARVVPAGSSWSRREGNDRSEASDGKGR